MKYVKKPVVIDAWKVSDLLKLVKSEWDKLPNQITEAYHSGQVLIYEDTIVILTLEGAMTASYDDFIICGVKGELYPCKPDIFSDTYSMIGSGF